MSHKEPVAPVFQLNRVYPDIPSPRRDTLSPPNPAHFHTSVFPDIPTPPRDRPSSPSPAQIRKKDPEEKIIGSFIQWAKSDKKKVEKKVEKKKRIMSESPKEQQEDLTTKDKTDSEKIRETKDDKTGIKHKLFKKKDKGKKPCKSAKKSSLFKNVHLSRPATPAAATTADTDPDKYRIMYLIVRIEQQMEHVRNVLKTMTTHNTEKFRITSMVKVKDSLANLKSQLLGINNNDSATMKQFPTPADLEEFFGAIETICSSVEEVPLEGCGVDLDLDHVVNWRMLGKGSDGKTRVRTSKTSASKSNDVIKLFKVEGVKSEGKGMDSNTRTPLAREKLTPPNVKHRPSREAVDDDNDVCATRRRSDGRESCRRKSGTRRQNQRNTDDDNDVVISKRHSAVTSKKYDTTSQDVTQKNEDVGSVNDTRDKLTTDEKRQLLRNARLQLRKGRSVVAPVEIARESWSDDPDEEDLLADNGATWPQIPARRHDIRHREHEFNSLMDDIDTLMANTNIKNGKLTIAGMSFEELMSGQRIGDGGRRRSDEPRKPRPPLIPGNQSGARSVRKNVNKNGNKPDKFIEEFDQFLNECDNVI